MDYIFSKKISFPEVPICFLCGTKFLKDNEEDKRKIIKDYLLSSYPNMKVVILEEHFTFGYRKGYLNYDRIFMKNLNDIEMLTAAFANKIIIIHESISTGAEMAVFASNEYLNGKICILEPDNIDVEEEKLTSFLKLAYFRKGSNLEKIIFYPETYSYPISKNHIEIRTKFLDNSIKPVLSNKIKKFIDKDFKSGLVESKFLKCKYGKVSSDIYEVNYKNASKGVDVFVSSKLFLHHIMSLFLIKEFRNTLREEKELFEHITYILITYKSIIQNTISEVEGKKIDNININIKELSIDDRTICAFSLYMLQALDYVEIKTIASDNCQINTKSIFSKIFIGYEGLLCEKQKSAIMEKING